MARGEMVRFMAENDIENPDDIKSLTGLVIYSGLIYHQIVNMFLNAK